MLSRIKVWVAAHAAIAGLVTTLMFAGGAAAAWIIYASTVKGTLTQNFTAGTTQEAVTVTDTGTGDVQPQPCTSGTGLSCTGGTDGIINLKYHNNTPQAESVTGAGVTFTVSPSTCPASGLFVKSIVMPSGTIAANSDSTSTGLKLDYVADSSDNVPACQGATITATVTGSTNP